MTCKTKNKNEKQKVLERKMFRKRDERYVTEKKWIKSLKRKEIRNKIRGEKKKTGQKLNIYYYSDKSP